MKNKRGVGLVTSFLWVAKHVKKYARGRKALILGILKFSPTKWRYELSTVV